MNLAMIRKKLFHDIVKPAVEAQTGLPFVDASLFYESEGIKMDLIEKMIDDASIVVVDITRMNANVFIELGIAYSERKMMLLICEEKAWKASCPCMIQDAGATRVQWAWNNNPPFDLSGREIIVYGNDKELKIELNKALFDCCFSSESVVPSWSSCVKKLPPERKYSTPGAHFLSPDKMTIEHEEQDSDKKDPNKHEKKFGKAWNTFSINNIFNINCKIKIEIKEKHDKDADVRLCLSHELDGKQRIAVIFPWECSGDRQECHITYYDDYTKHAEGIDHARVQQVVVCQKKPTEFRFSLSFCWPHLVVESDVFDEKRDRICVSLEQLRQLGYPTHLKQFIGFNVMNCKATISNIKIKAASNSGLFRSNG